MPTQLRGQLIRHSKDTYGEDFNAVLFDQYKHYVESAEKISERRVTTNNYFLTVNVSLVSVFGIISSNSIRSAWVVLLPLVGIIVAITWYRVIHSYRNLNTVKFAVIHELEQYTPAALYDYEWQKADEGKGKVYRPVSHLEAWVPVAFMVLFGALVIVVILVSLGWVVNLTP
jgi:hypothetical protein